MVMNVKPVPTLDERINDIRMRTAAIVNEYILPNEDRLWASRREGADEQTRKEARELRTEVSEAVKKAGLWAPHLPQEYGGMGLDFLAHAYMNEVLAYAMGAASLFGVVAPNEGYNRQPLTCYFPELGMLLGYAVTAVVSTHDAPDRRLPVSSDENSSK